MSCAYCEVCHHSVFSLAKHLLTEEHRRALRRISLGGLKPPSKPKLHKAETKYGLRRKRIV